MTKHKILFLLLWLLIRIASKAINRNTREKVCRIKDKSVDSHEYPSSEHKNGYRYAIKMHQKEFSRCKKNC